MLLKPGSKSIYFLYVGRLEIFLFSFLYLIINTIHHMLKQTKMHTNMINTIIYICLYV